MAFRPHARGRALSKCEFCRTRKKKCEPVERAWPGQKCNACEHRGLACGPNIRTRACVYSKAKSNACLQPDSSMSTQLHSQPQSHLSGQATTLQLIARPEVFMIPFCRDPDFTGRTTEMNHLVDILCGTQGHVRAAMVGLGGVGKSQIAIEFAYRAYRMTFDQIYWLNGSTLARFEQSCSEALSWLGIARSDQIYAYVQLQHYLQSTNRGRWLVIIDDVETIDIAMVSENTANSTSFTSQTLKLSEFLPHHPYGSVLTTTRSSDTGLCLADPAMKLEIGLMNTDDAFKLLERKISQYSGGKSLLAPGSMRYAHELLSMLSCWPLAVTQAATYIVLRDVPLPTCVKQCKEEQTTWIKILRGEMGNPRMDSWSSSSVLLTLRRTLDELHRKQTFAMQLLSRLCVFKFESGFSYQMLYKDDTSKYDVDRAIDVLLDYGLVTPGSNQKSISYTNDIIFASVREWLVDCGLLYQTQEDLANVAHSRLKAANDMLWSEAAPKIEFRWLQYLKCLPKSKDAQLQAKIGYLARRISLAYQCPFSTIDTLLESSKIQRNTSSEDRSDVLLGARLLILVLCSQCKYEAAKTKCREILEEAAHFPESVSLADRSNLVALSILQRTSAPFRDLFDMYNDPQYKRDLHVPVVLAANENLAFLASSPREAKDEYLKLQRIRQSVLGYSHPFTMVNRTNVEIVSFLGSAATMTTALLGAIACKHKDLLLLRGKSLGRTHASTGKSINNIAVLAFIRGVTSNDPNVTQYAIKNQRYTWENSFKVSQAFMLELGLIPLRNLFMINQALMHFWSFEWELAAEVLGLIQCTSDEPDTSAYLERLSNDVDKIRRAIRAVTDGSYLPTFTWNNSYVKAVPTVATEHPDTILIELMLGLTLPAELEHLATDELHDQTSVS